MCSAGHGNLGEHRFQAESQDDANSKVREIDLPTRCYFCPSVELRPSSTVQIIGVEELPEYPSYTCLGYVCQCGERVAVLRIREGEGVSHLQSSQPFVRKDIRKISVSLLFSSEIFSIGKKKIIRQTTYHAEINNWLRSSDLASWPGLVSNSFNFRSGGSNAKGRGSFRLHGLRKTVDLYRQSV